MIERKTIKFNGFSNGKNTIVAKLPKGKALTPYTHMSKGYFIKGREKMTKQQVIEGYGRRNEKLVNEISRIDLTAKLVTLYQQGPLKSEEVYLLANSLSVFFDIVKHNQ